MHIPDGFLDTRTAVTTGILAVTGIAVALRQARRHLPPRRVPLLGLAAAFVFAAQTINFPVPGGTSGHLLGAVLAAALLGPSAAVIALSAVLIVQCLVFADGGISALGANVFNMAILGGVGGWAVYTLVRRALRGPAGRLLAAAFAAWCSTVAASVACAGELAASGIVRWHLVLPAMAGVHMVIGLGEGLVTALVLAAVARTRPDLLEPELLTGDRRPYVAVVAYGGIIVLGAALFLPPVASRWPDGLQRVAERLGFEGRAIAPLLPAPMGGYGTPGIHWATLATSIAVTVGTLAVFVLAWLLARALVSRGDRHGGSTAAKEP